VASLHWSVVSWLGEPAVTDGRALLSAWDSEVDLPAWLLGLQREQLPRAALERRGMPRRSWSLPASPCCQPAVPMPSEGLLLWKLEALGKGWRRTPCRMRGWGSQAWLRLLTSQCLPLDQALGVPPLESPPRPDPKSQRAVRFRRRGSFFQ